MTSQSLHATSVVDPLNVRLGRCRPAEGQGMDILQRRSKYSDRLENAPKYALRDPQNKTFSKINQSCSPRDRGLGLETARDRFFCGLGLGLGLGTVGLGLGLGLED